MIFVWLVLAVCFLAYSNGANDNFKGVASLFGCGAASYRVALAWATLSTAAGSVAAIFLAQALLKTFSGKGLVPDTLISSEAFLTAVALGAGLTVILATYTGFPISTTHALTGALVGSGWVAVGTQINLQVLGQAFFLPLFVTPLLAVILGGSYYFVARWLRLRLGINKEWCVCVGTEQRTIPMPQPISVLSIDASQPVITCTVDEPTVCAQRYTGSFLGIQSQQAMDLAHFASAGVVSFARGLNDTPKIAALLLIVPNLDSRWGLIAVAIAMAVGGMLSAQRIAQTMSHKITALNHGQGFSANLTTAVLVTFASLLGMPVSTTHVSVGALVGIGLVSQQANWRVTSNILLSWLITLPCAALLSAVAYAVLSR